MSHRGPSARSTDQVQARPLSPEQRRSTALHDAAPARRPEPVTPLKRCPDCGADLGAMNSPKCPGCGVNIISAIRRHQSNAAAASEVVDRYRRALIPLVASYAVLLLVLLVGGDPASEANGHMSDLAWFALRQAVFVPFAVAVYAVICAAWLGFEQPFIISVMGLMSAVAIADTVGFFAYFLPVMFLSQFVVAITMMLVVPKLLDLEMQEGFLVGLVLGALRYPVHLVLATAVQ